MVPSDFTFLDCLEKFYKVEDLDKNMVHQWQGNYVKKMH
jgi:hypothetical protein